MSSRTLPTRSLGTVLITGGCGMLGSSFIEQLLNFPNEDKTGNDASPFPTLSSRYPRYTATKVHALDLKCDRNIIEGCTYHAADITSVDQLLEVFRKVKPDVIFNTASPHWEAPQKVLYKVNVDGTRMLLDVAGGKAGDWGGKCKMFVHTSSASVVHDCHSHLINATEEYPYVIPNKYHYYSETKAYAEKMVLDANDTPEFGNMLTCAIRPAGILGERDLTGISGAILANAAKAKSRQLHIQIGPGTFLFDVTYTGNVVYGHLCAAEALQRTLERRSQGKAEVLDHERVDGEAFNVTNDQPAYFWDIYKFLNTSYGREIYREKITIIPPGLSYYLGWMLEIVGWLTRTDQRLTRQASRYMNIHRYYSCEKIKRRCGYEPIVDSEESIMRAAHWYKGYEEERKAKAAQNGHTKAE